MKKSSHYKFAKERGKKNAKMHIHNNDALSFITRISASI
jgi:hypothetical protein